MTALSPAGSASAPAAPPRILIIDDDPTDHELISAILGREGYELRFASSGPIGLEEVARISPQVICCDVMMPGMTGIEVCARLKSNPATRQIPVIAVTALDSREFLAEILAAGADDFVGKPIQPGELRARLRSMLRISRQYELLESALRMRADLTYMLVHDLRGPLSGMQLALDLLRLDPLTPRQGAAMETLEGGGERLQRLIHDLLVMGRIESGCLPLQRTRAPLVPLLERAVASRRPIAESHGLVLECLPGPEAGIEVSIDVPLIERLLDNLLSNAMKFSPAGGRIVVRAMVSGEECRLEIADEGIGVPPELSACIFEKYEVGRIHPGVVQIGLGLAFCKLVAEAHGGGVAYRPNAPRGSIFSVKWPL